MLAHGLSASLPIRRDSPWCGNRNCKSTKSRNKPISQCAAGSILLRQPARLIGEADRPRPADPCLSAVLSSGTRNSLQLNARAIHTIKRSFKQVMQVVTQALMQTPSQLLKSVCQLLAVGSGLSTARSASFARVLHTCLVPIVIFRVQPVCPALACWLKPLTSAASGYYHDR